MPPSTSGDATSTGTVARVAMLLRVLAEAEGEATLGQIAERMRLPPSTTHRLLHLLAEQGFVERGQGARTYKAGLEFLRVGGLVASRADLTDLAANFMQAVVDECDETCMLSLYVPRPSYAMVAKVIYGSHPLRYEAKLYTPTSLAWGATGRGILAFLPAKVIDAVIEREGPSPVDSRKMIAPQQLHHDLATIRQQGYAHTIGQKVPGAVGFSAPVFNNGGVVAALCITLPDNRYEPAMEPKLAHALTTQARRFSLSLGWRGAAPAAQAA
jgi:DNA-binding IclR family transcriptional regulator